MVFQLKVPDSGTKEGGKVLEQMNKAKVYQNPNDAVQTEYVKNLIAGNYMLDEEPDIIDLVTKINRDGDSEGTVVDLSFRVNSHEPLGATKFWMAWEEYDEYPTCLASDTCLRSDRVTMQQYPFKFYNAENFGNMIDRGFLMTSYWIIEGTGIFWLLGTPVNLLMYIIMNAYVQIVTFVGFFVAIIAATGGYEEEQRLYYTIENWFLELVVYWSTGTFLFSTLLFTLVNGLPILGPIIGVILVLAVDPLVVL